MVSCPCCGYQTITEDFDVCAICAWEHDPGSELLPDQAAGANRISLEEAQENFAAFGASQPELSRMCRKPRATERRDTRWKPIKEYRPVDLALLRAAYVGDLGSLKKALGEGADPEARVRHGILSGWTALMLAVSRGAADLADELLARGVDANARGAIAGTPLLIAVQRSEKRMVEALLKAGASPTVPDARGTDPIVWARGHNEEEILKLLL